MQSQGRSSQSGEEELTQVAQRCMNSSVAHLFVVGPPRSGKSTRLPVLLSALSGKKVICVQPDDRVAQCHANWIESNVAGVFAGKKVRIGYHKDEEDMDSKFIPEYDVTYVSSRWLYRMVVGVNFDESSVSRMTTRITANRSRYQYLLKIDRIARGNVIGYVLLDEVHAQSVIQELGYIAIHAASSGLVEGPLGFTKETKVICTTAYPENNTFLRLFDLSDKEIEKRLIKINTGLAPARKHEIRETFIPEHDKGALQYHILAGRQAKEILKSNREARILLLMDTMYSVRNISRQDPFLHKTVKVLDLEAENDWTVMSKNKHGPIVVLATPSFASRIPVEGITDVICPPSQLLPGLSKKLHKEIYLDVYLSRWEFAWAKSHLDPGLKEATIHHMFKHSIYLGTYDNCGARFRAADFVDILLGTIRLCQHHALGARSPMRFPIPLNTAERAFRHLTILPSVIAAGIESSPEETHWIMSPELRTPPMLDLMDRCGLDRRQAFFLGYLRQSMSNAPSKYNIRASRQRFLTTIAVAMVVFSDGPILRLTSHHGPGTEMPSHVFPNLRHYFHLGDAKDFTSDSWINAVVWMDIKRREFYHGTSMTSFAQKFCNPKNLRVDWVPLEAAESKLRFLARMVGLDEESQDALCRGLFLDEVGKFNQDKCLGRDWAAATLWQAQLYAFQFQLVYVTVEKDSIKMVDVSTNITVEYDPTHLAVNLFEQARRAGAHRGNGFYATFTTRTGFGYRGLTVMPVDVVCKITQDTEHRNGAFDLRIHLSLE
ncbi:hypothetical protein F4859DRAFT_521711 [Xylaria cf. heliscus]|nr:hypothetical protein F4859DRAFT_521711 [Xylaria cf. heliscus]